ncbi:MAG: acyl-CoA thioesterase [Sphingomonadales bacterium]
MAKIIEPVIRTSPRPSDLNKSGNIFGGWILSQMDTAGGITAARRAGGRVATVAIEAMSFHKPVAVGDLISCYTEIVREGRTSISVKINVLANRMGEAEEITVTEGTFIFVAIDEKNRPRPLPDTKA